MVAKLKFGEAVESDRAARARSAEMAHFYIHRAVEELEKAAGIASQLQNKSDRAHICEAIWLAKVTLHQVSLRSPGNPEVVSCYGVMHAADCIAKASEALAAGVDSFGLLFEAAQCLGQASTRSGLESCRQEKASPKLAASRMLRELAELHPELSAAALRRLLEAKTGGRMDESAARAVVRAVRAAQGEATKLRESLESVIKEGPG